jgi:uncharacterized protein (DUF58 family)
MRVPLRPGRPALAAVAAGAILALAAVMTGLSAERAFRLALGWLAVLAMATAGDYALSLRAWRRDGVRMTRRLPPAFAIGVARPVALVLANQGPRAWRCELHDGADGSLVTSGLPRSLALPAVSETDTAYTATPTRRGLVAFAPADLRVRSRWGLCDLLLRIGAVERRRVYPDFAQIARYAWLAGDRRLQEIGIKSYRLRGEGTDFKQLSEYQVGDSIRHIDWKATLRVDRPIVREFQDDRDQAVLLLVDCGRRMRADDRGSRTGTTHFDQVLNAVMLLSYVALRQGDAVGAVTFGTPPEDERAFMPRKGMHTLARLMGELYAVQPTATHSDYVVAAQRVLGRHPRRALVVIITNFRDEDSRELEQALRLLRSRHLVLVASLRERIVRELIEQPLTGDDAPIDVASAHLYSQSRRDAFHRLSARDALMVDAEPDRLGIELVNRYHAAKRAGLI